MIYDGKLKASISVDSLPSDSASLSLPATSDGKESAIGLPVRGDEGLP